MQPYFIPVSDKQSPPTSDPYSFISPKTSSTSTADSYVSPYYSYLGDADCPPEKMGLHFLVRFNSLTLSEDGEGALHDNAEPRRHASELHSAPYLASSQQLPHQRPAPNDFRAPRSTFSTTKVANTANASGEVNGVFYDPYASTMARQSTGALPQYFGNVPIYSVPQYYAWQPEAVPTPVLYGYYDYPKAGKQRKYSGARKQVFSTTDVVTNVSSELSEKALLLVKEYETSGDHRKLAGAISDLAKVQSGSRFLQKELGKSNSDFLAFVIREVRF